MSGSRKVIGFVVVAIVALAVAVGIGRWVGPIDADDDEHAHQADDRIRLQPADQGEAGEGDGHSHAEGEEDYRLELERSFFDAGRQTLAFTVVDHHGRPVTSYDVQHEKLLHLVVVRRDLGGYRHVHPTLEEGTGTWTTPLDLDAGAWRVYADFTPAGEEQAVAEADVSVGGDYTPRELPAASDTATVGDYEVHLTRAGDALSFHVTRGDEEVTDLQPYLGAFGHLVAIRADDLTYLHVHPEADGGDQPPADGEVAFHAELGAAGAYRLFFEFRHDGAVRRAEFTVTADGSTSPAPESPSPDESESEHGGHDH